MVRYCGLFYGQLADGSSYHEAIMPDALTSVLKQLPPGLTELACHPALGNDLKTMYRLEREIEVSTLCDPSIKTLILREGLELTTFRKIPF